MNPNGNPQNLRRGGQSAPAPWLNLWRDGYEEVAEQVVTRQRRNGGTVVVQVMPDGGVYCSPKRKAPEHAGIELIGHYDSSTRTEWVEDDLLHWMREQTKKHAA